MEKVRLVTTGMVALLTFTGAFAQGRAQSAAPWWTPSVIGLDAYQSYAGVDSITLDLPLPGGDLVTLQLSAFEIFTPDARFVLGGLDGDVELPRPRLALFRGNVAGVADSTVFLSLTPDMVNGLIEYGDHSYVISSGPYGAGLDPVVLDLRSAPEDAMNWAGFLCETDASSPPLKSDEPEDPRIQYGLGGEYCTEMLMAIETDRELTVNRFGGSTEASGAYIGTLFAAINEIYVRDFDLPVAVGFVRLWTGQDPWNANSTTAQLNQFQDYWNNNMRSVDRDLAHMVSARNLGGGVAYLGVICSQITGYAVSANINGSFPFPIQDNNSNNWDLMVVAHEIGHNVGAPHTHDKNPQIDGCGTGDCSLAGAGTIMSYCHLCSGGMRNIRMGFHARIISEDVVPTVQRSCVFGNLGPQFIETPPLQQRVCVGEQVSMSLVVDTVNPSYQWRVDGVDLVDDGRVQGANSPTLTIGNVSLADVSNNYRCIVLDLDTNCQRKTRNLALLVDDTQAVIVSQPSNQDVTVGGVILLDVHVQDETIYDFQWRHDGVDLVDDERIAGSQNSVLIIVDAGFADAGRYSCEIVERTCAVSTRNARVRVFGDCPGDLDGDGQVGLSDLSVQLASFGTPSGADPSDGDLDGDGDVDLEDLSLMLSFFGDTCV